MLPTMTRFLCLFFSLALVLQAEEHPKVFDGSPKRFFFMHNSHQGMSEFQKVVEKLGKQSGHTFTRYQGRAPFLENKKTGELRLRPPKSFLPADENDKVIFIWQEEGDDVWLNWHLMVQEGMAEADAIQKANEEAAERFLVRYAMLKEAGIQNIFFVGYHYHPSQFRNKAYHSGSVPPPKASDFSTTRLWMKMVNEKLGRTVCFDGREQTAPYWPYTVGADGRHGSRPSFAKYIRYKTWIETVSREEGNPIEIDVDIDAMVQEAKALRHVVSKVKVEGDLVVGGEVTISWEANPSVETVSISCQTVAGYYDETPYAPGPRCTSPSVWVAKDIPASKGKVVWKIPESDHGTRDKKKKGRKVPLASSSARFFVEAGTGNNVPGLCGTEALAIQAAP